MAEKHFYEQTEHTKSYLIPYFEKHIPDFKERKIFEVGCAEAGFIDVLDKLNVEVTGLELEAGRVDIIKQKNPSLKVLVGDIADSESVKKINKKFDLIVIRDVIEHIPDKEKTFENMYNLLNEDGYLYITFPPKFSAYAGHQQNCTTLLKAIPFLHILPDWLIRLAGKILGEKNIHIESIIENYKNGLSISRFKNLYNKFLFKPCVKEVFLFRPVFRVRYKTSIKKFPNIPLFREIFAFGCEYLLRKK